MRDDPMAIVPADDTDWTLEVTISDSPIPIRFTIDRELLIGRVTPTEMVFTGLDLTPFRGIEFGVSRHHAAIRQESDRLVIVDLGSGNGTYLNGVRLQPENPYRLTEGDRLQIGRLEMKVHLNAQIGQSSIKARRIDLDLSRAPVMARGQRILVVEDDPMITKLYDAALQKAGFSVQICRDVVSAIRAFKQDIPALLLIDMKLPSVPGLELCRYLRRDTENADIPIVIASAIADKETVEQAMEAEADVYFAKPINIKELVRTVAALVYKAEAANPRLTTKRLSGTASLARVPALPRRDTLVLFADGHREPLSITVETSVTLGRHSAGSPIHNAIDLEPYGAFEKGVSRSHVKIKRQDNTFLVEDLGSANGTFINGLPLRQQEIKPISNGDELRLGELQLHVFFLEEAEATQGQEVTEH
jgi:DNA-binding response OmpR family regulator/pSer/pThr/pTyr-binding forkhead associated (FHA) protein